VNGARPVRAFSMRPNLEAPGHDTEITPTLIAFAPGDIDPLHQSPAALSHATAQLAKLIKALNQAMKFDRNRFGT
jgi:hypothetical protein